MTHFFRPSPELFHVAADRQSAVAIHRPTEVKLYTEGDGDWLPWTADLGMSWEEALRTCPELVRVQNVPVDLSAFRSKPCPECAGTGWLCDVHRAGACRECYLNDCSLSGCPRCTALGGCGGSGVLSEPVLIVGEQCRINTGSPTDDFDWEPLCGDDADDGDWADSTWVHERRSRVLWEGTLTSEIPVVASGFEGIQWVVDNQDKAFPRVQMYENGAARIRWMEYESGPVDEPWSLSPASGDTVSMWSVRAVDIELPTVEVPCPDCNWNSRPGAPHPRRAVVCSTCGNSGYLTPVPADLPLDRIVEEP